MLQLKTCRECKQELELSSFYKFFHKRDNKYRYTNLCKACNKNICKKRRQSILGMYQDIYNGQILSSKKRKHCLPNYTLNELIHWAEQQPNINTLINGWIDNNYSRDLKPSCDRLDNGKPYTLDNLRLVSFKENCLKANEDTKNNILQINQRKVAQYTKEGIFITKYNSIAEACRATTCAPGNLVKCCQGEYKTSKGFIWRYANDE